MGLLPVTDDELLVVEIAAAAAAAVFQEIYPALEAASED